MFDKYTSLSEDDLLTEIGRELDADHRDALPRPLEYFRKRGQQFVENRAEAIRQVICPNATIRRLVEGGFTSELIAAVAALLETLAVGTAVTPLAVLLCKAGLGQFCNVHWDGSRSRK